MSVATKALIMHHEGDPAVELMKQIEPYLDDITLMGPSVLCATYVRPEKTKSGIILSSGEGHTRNEDIYQGKVQLLVKKGAEAFVSDGEHKFEVVPEIGQWVMIRVGDSFQFKLADVHCRIVIDSNIRAILKRPDIAL